MTDHEQPAAGLALTKASEVMALIDAKANDPLIAVLRRAGTPDAVLIEVAYTMIADRKDSIVELRPTPTVDGEVTREIEERLKGILIEEGPMHPFGCATWEEESRIAIDIAIDSLRSLAADRDKAVGLLRELTFIARTSGGTAGPDEILKQACASVETYLSSQKDQPHD